MPGSILSHFVPFSVNGLLYGLYDYLLPVMLYCGWSALGLLDLARSDQADRGRVVGWSAAIVALPVVGAAAYLLFGRSTLSATVRVSVVTLGVVLVVAAYGYTMIRVG